MLIELLTKKYPGMRLWQTQRLSAVVMAVYLVLLAVVIAIRRPADYDEWLGFMSPWWWRGLTLVFFISLFIHAWLGVRDVFKDYVFNLGLRAFLQIVVDVLLIIYLCLVTYILWDI